MSNEVMTLLARLEGDPSGMVSALKNGEQSMKQLQSTAKTSAEETAGHYGKMKDSVVGTLKELAGPMLAAFSVAAVVDWGKETVKQLAEVQVLNAQTGAAIKSTGASANVTASQVDVLSRSLEKQTGTSHEAIQSGANLLLTFKGIKNEAGAGNNVYDQSVTALTNMARAMGTDPQTSAIQLGKALNDPTKGISALTRVGVTFSQSQKDLIKSMQASGDTMGAQKIILKELNSEFGASGAAYLNTYSGSVARMHQEFDDLSQKLLSGVMPVLTQLAKRAGAALGWLSERKGVEDFGTNIVGAFTKGYAAVKPFVDAIGGTLGPIIKTLGPQVLQLVSAFSPMGLVLKAMTPVLPIIASLLQQVAAILSSQLASVLPVINDLVTKLVGALSGELAAILPSIATLVSQLGGMLISLMPAVMNIVSAVGSALLTVLKALMPVLPVLIDAFISILAALLPIIPPVLSIVEAFLPLLKIFGTLIASLLPPVIKLVMALLGPIMALISPLVSLLAPALQFVAGLLKNYFAVEIAVVMAVVNALAAVITWLASVWSAEFKFMQAVVGAVVGAVAAMWNAGVRTFTDGFNMVVAGARGMASIFGAIFGAIGGFIANGFSSAVGVAKGAINGLIKLINGAIQGLDRLHISIPAWVPIIGGKSLSLNIPTIPGLATGGSVVSPGLTWVGERGPELLNLPAGAQVTSNEESRAAVSAAASGPTELSDASIEKLARALAAQMRVSSRQGAAA